MSERLSGPLKLKRCPRADRTDRRMPATPVKALPAFELKSGSLSLLSFTLKTAALELLTADLDRQITDAPGLYDHEPVVLDLAQVRQADPPPDVAALVSMLRERGLLPVAVKGGNAEQTADALALGLAEAPEFAAPPPRAATACWKSPPVEAAIEAASLGARIKALDTAAR